jgi:hypothetical protein
LDKKILILLPVWKREAITKICFANLKELQKKFDIEVLCVVSEQWSKIEAFKHGFRYVEAPNECLGTKMNIGIKKALEYKFDYLMNLGSDDIITEELFKCYEPFFKNDIQFFGSTRLTFLDSESKEAVEYDYKGMMGAGRCIRRDVLEKTLKRGDIYDKIQCGLDMNSASKFRCSQTEIENPFRTIIDIKSKVNIWDYEVMSLKGKKIDFEKAVDGLSTKQIDSILNL